jgi:DNA-binding HxlR family transcriptional regulator
VRSSVEDAPDYCAIEFAMEVLGGRWKLAILKQLSLGTHRFGELKRAMPTITQRMLTRQLRELEADGLLTRTVYREVPPRVEYTLTEVGHSRTSGAGGTGRRCAGRTCGPALVRRREQDGAGGRRAGGRSACGERRSIRGRLLSPARVVADARTLRTQPARDPCGQLFTLPAPPRRDESGSRHRAPLP